MITPMMYVLSALDNDGDIDHQVSIQYLDTSDKSLVQQEAHRLGELVLNENMISRNPENNNRVLENQVVAGSIFPINRYTALLLDRFTACYEVLKKHRKNAANNVSSEHDDIDLGADTIVMRLEQYPQFIYKYVYTVLSSKNSDFVSKIAKLTELYNTIVGFSNNKKESDNNNGRDPKLVARLEQLGDLNYWKRILMSDYVEEYKELPPVFDADTIKTIKSDLSKLGFYGFINPLEMYNKFSVSRIARKNTLDIEPFVIDFLEKIVKSGGLC